MVLSNIAFGQLNRNSSVEEMKRDDGKFYVWVYFNDKGTNPSQIDISNKTINRRKKLDSEIDFGWYDANPADNYIDQVLQKGVKLRGESRWLNAISIECDEEQLLGISNLPFVKDIKPIVQFKKKNQDEIETDRTLERSFSSYNLDYGNSYEQLEQINVPAAHNAGYDGEGVRILILDTGFNLEHPVFDSLNVISEWDVINNDSTTANEDHDGKGSSQHNHGTSVLSIVGGYTPGRLIGPAFKSNYMLAKTEVIGSETQIEEDHFIRGLEWGESLGADIVTTSLGYTDWYVLSDIDGNTALVTKAFDLAASLGMICITSAGNENGNAWDAIAPPADADSVISVGAVDNDGQIAYFSSRGPTADGRIKPEVCARGVSTHLASGNGVSYSTGPGTSYAAPLVAGAAALILQAHPTWTPMMVRQAMMETASKSHAPDNTFGWGILDTWAAINYSGGDILKPELFQSYPNPFNASATIEYLLKQSSNVELRVFNVLGQEIKTLVNKFEPSGQKSVTWNGKDNDGVEISSGVYFYSLKIGDDIITNKMVLVR